MRLTFGSVCSGIEAASVAWDSLGWRAAWFSEVDGAASAVLAYRFPTVPNHGDMTLLAEKVRRREIPAPDILVGGTPCQAFSVAGLRGGLADARGQLTLAFVLLADAIDEIRLQDGLLPVIIVWENVPGVLNHADNPLGCFLAGIAGDSDPLEPGPRPEHGRSAAYWTWQKGPGEHRPKWPNAGAAVGPKRAIAWRTLDAQYFRLAQRRRRVFVVASARPGFDPAAILLEFDGLRRDSAPSREAGQGVAGTLDARTDGGGFPGTDGACSGHVVPAAIGDDRGLGTGVKWPAEIACTPNAHFGDKQGLEDQHINGGGVCSYLPSVSMCLNAGAMGRRDAESETLIPMHGGVFDDAGPIAFSSKDYGADATQDISPTLRAGGHADSHANAGGTPAVCYGMTTEQTPKVNSDCALTLTKQSPTGGGQIQAVAYAIQERAVAENPSSGPDGVGVRSDDLAHTLEARPAVQATAYSIMPMNSGRDYKARETDISQPPMAGGPVGGNQGGDFIVQPTDPAAVCVTGSVTHTLKAEGFDASEDGTGRGQPIVPAVVGAICRDSFNEVRLMNGDGLIVGALAAEAGMKQQCYIYTPPPAMAVRRLMPVECERLQGFPDNWTLVPNARGKLAADGPRYKQCGNSMATHCMHWIGSRIDNFLRGAIGHNGGPALTATESHGKRDLIQWLLL